MVRKQTNTIWPRQLQLILTTFQLTPRELARALSTQLQVVQSWSVGRTHPRGAAATLLLAMLSVIQQTLETDASGAPWRLARAGRRVALHGLGGIIFNELMRSGS